MGSSLSREKYMSKSVWEDQIHLEQDMGRNRRDIIMCLCVGRSTSENTWEREVNIIKTNSKKL